MTDDGTGQEARSSARARFAELVRVEKNQPPLAETALVVAQEEYPDLAPRTYLARLHAFGSVVADHLRSQWPGTPVNQIPIADRVGAVNRYLFEELGFRGNREAYYDPRNSYLNEVIDRRLGIPITLSLVYMEVAAAVGLRLVGVSFPGHFLVRTRGSRPTFFLDPFEAGGRRSVEELRGQLAKRGLDWQGTLRVLRGASNHDVIRRLLTNLKSIHLRSGDFARALGAVERLLLLDPGSAPELRDLGLTTGKLGRYRESVRALEGYLRAAPEAGDRADVERLLADSRYWQSRLN